MIMHTTASYGRVKSANSARAYDFIRSRILNGEFKPGETLLAISLAKEIGVSRTPVRDALRQLESEGMVVGKFRESVSVKELDVQEVREACAIYQGLMSRIAVIPQNPGHL